MPEIIPNSIEVGPAKVYIGDGADGWTEIGTTETGVIFVERDAQLPAFLGLSYPASMADESDRA